MGGGKALAKDGIPRVLRIDCLGDFVPEHAVGAINLQWERRWCCRVVGAVVNAAHQYVLSSHAVLDVTVRPAAGSDRRVPTCAAVRGNLDASHHAAAAISCGTAQRHFGTIGHGGSCGRAGHDNNGRRLVRTGRCGDKGRVKGGRLGAHVRQQVHFSLAHARVRRRTVAVVVLVQTPTPLDTAGREDQGSGGVLVQSDVVRRGSRQDGVSIVLQILGSFAHRC